MLEKHGLKVLSDAVRDSWKDVNLARVNGLDVRFRVVMDGAAKFRKHADSDEVFCCLDGVAHWILLMALRRRSGPLSLLLSPAIRCTASGSRAEPSCSSLFD